MKKEYSFEFKCLMDSTDIADKINSLAITIQPNAAEQKPLKTMLNKTSTRGAELNRLLNQKENNAQEIAEFLIDKVFMLDIPTYKTLE